MPRKSGPWFRTARKMWFANIEGKQHPLHVTDPADLAGAEVAHRTLIEQLAVAIAAKMAAPTPPAKALATVADGVVSFLAQAERKVASGRLTEQAAGEYRRDLSRMVPAFGHRALVSLMASEIEEWAARPEWSSSTQNNIIGTIQMMLRWNGIALSPPIHRPPKESRGAETILTEPQFAIVLAELRKNNDRGDLPELLEMLRETGARPQEIATLRADGVDWPNSCARLSKHKTRRHTGADRVIHFSAAALAILKSQREKRVEGLLFRTRHGNAYRPTVIVRRLWEVSDRVGFRVIAYGLGRHSFATRALEAGIPDVVVAGLLGQKGTAMLHKHYSHIGQNAQLLKDAAERASRGRAS